MKKCLFFIVASLFLIACEAKKYDFSLQDESGKSVSLKDFAGKKLIVYFGYTFCPDVCPITLAMLSKELKEIGDEKAYILFISLDLQRDNDLKKSNEWLRYFYPNSASLLAKNEEELKKITSNYGVIFERVDLKGSAMVYSIAHSNELFLIDEKGKFFAKIQDLSEKNLRQSLEKFLATKG